MESRQDYWSWRGSDEVGSRAWTTITHRENVSFQLPPTSLFLFDEKWNFVL